MQRVLVAVLVALALLQPVRPQVGAQETEDNHSTSRGRDQPTVLNLDHYLLQLNNKLDTLNSKLDALDSKLDTVDSKLDTLDIAFSQHKQQTAAELAQLQTSLQSSLTTHTQQVHENLQNNLTHQLDVEQLPVYNYTCGGTGGWRRVVYLDMTDLNTTCPSGWRLTRHSKRTCGRVIYRRGTCDSVTFPVSGGEYSRVCGRIKAYQWGFTKAFYNYYYGSVTTVTIDDYYVDGISVTHRCPRQHIWTFAAGRSESNPTQPYVCPCDASRTIRVPPFVGNDYFCESGLNESWVTGNGLRHYTLHSDDPLWDGENCLSSSTCCSLHNPPYFVKQLPTPTTDDIEARICLQDPSYWANIAVELVELYVQ